MENFTGQTDESSPPAGIPEDPSTPDSLPESEVSARPPLRLRTPLACLCLGLLVLGGLAALETYWLKSQPWSRAFIVQSGVPSPWEGTIPIATRQIDATNYIIPEALKSLEHEPLGVLEMLGYAQREYTIALTLNDETWRSLVDTGRPPTPGTREVIAGALCRLNQFTIDDDVFTVVGRIKPGAAGLSCRYLCRDDSTTAPYFDDADLGWIDPWGGDRPESDAKQLQENELVHFVMPMAPIPRLWSVVALIALGLVVYGGAATQVRLLLHWGNVGWLSGIMKPAVEHRRLFVACHVACYGAYFASSAIAIAAPRLNLNAMLWVTEMFTRGELSHIGEAYFAKDIFAATMTTFDNNFIVQTVKYAIVPSLVVPFFGLAKTMLSLGVAGFVLSPIWCNTNGRLTYHSITLSLEAEAYVIAAFAICVYAVHVARGFLRDPRYFFSAAHAVGAGTLISGGILLVAAFYEAVTLILLQ